MSKFYLYIFIMNLIIISNTSYSIENKTNDPKLNKNIITSDQGGTVKVKGSNSGNGGWSSSGDGFVAPTSELGEKTIIAGGDSSGGAVGGSGGSGGGSKSIKRSIASVYDVADIDADSIAINAAKKCLKKLNSTLVLNSTLSNNNLDIIKNEIISSVDKLKREKNTVDSAHFPDCVYYANEINDMKIKNLFFNPRTPSNDSNNDAISSGISK